MLEILQRRFFLFCTLILLLIALLGIKLGTLTLVRGESLSNETKKKSTTTEILRGQRGRILASKGQPLAYNNPSYNVQFRREDESKKTEAWRAFYTEVMIKTIDIIEKNGGKTIDTFAIYYDSNKHEYYFDWGNFGDNITEERKQELSAIREKNWRNNMYVSKEEKDKDGNIIPGDPPETLYHTLRKRFYIPEDMDYQQARKLLSIWQEVQLTSGTVDPVTIAYNVNAEVVAEIATRSQELDSMTAEQSTQRIYPKGELVSHIVGYMTRITDESVSINSLKTRGFDDGEMSKIANEQSIARRESAEKNGVQLDEAAEQDLANQVNIISGLGYSTSDLIGAEGIERTQEAFLTGNTYERHGKKTMEVSQSRIITRLVGEPEPASDGNDIVLTLDLELQQVADSALKKNIEEIRAEQTNLLIKNADEYESKRPLNEINKAESGSVVVMEVNTGNVLALVNYPSYDNNWFVGGLSAENWATLRDDPRKPLINHAISSPRPPGSIFKMAVGLAGLEEGVITTETYIDDESPYVGYNPETGEPRIKSGAPNCWQKNTSQHAHLDIVGALANSCNYFFFAVADLLEIDKLNEWAGERFGMAKTTNIELPGEKEGQIGGQKVHFDKDKPLRGIGGLVQQRSLIPFLKTICEESNYKVEDEKIEECAINLLRLVDETGIERKGEQIRQVLQQDLGIPLGLSKTKDWSARISSELTQLVWNLGYTVRTGIGQAAVLVTPIEVSRYISALVNGGILYDAHIVDRIIDSEGNVIKETEPTIASKLDADPIYLQKIKEGMRNVVSDEDGGTAGSAFLGYEYKSEIGGKTGTAQISVSASQNIDIENTAWMVAFAPYEKPEIAIVVCVPYGKSGALASTTVKEIVSFYMDRKGGDAQDKTSARNAPVQ